MKLLLMLSLSTQEVHVNSGGTCELSEKASKILEWWKEGRGGEGGEGREG